MLSRAAKHGGRPLIRLVAEVMTPRAVRIPGGVRHGPARVNQKLLLSGFQVLESGKVGTARPAASIGEAARRCPPWTRKKNGKTATRILTGDQAADYAPRSGYPPFIVRQFDGVLRRALRQDHFVLLVGESTAGKSRAAYELVRSELKNCRVVHPARRDTAQAAAELGGQYAALRVVAK